MFFSANATLGTSFRFSFVREFPRKLFPSAEGQFIGSDMNDNFEFPSEIFVSKISKYTRGNVQVRQSLDVRKLKQTTTTMATRTSLNKRFNEEKNSCARAV